ncbi:hypothetical protein D3C81_1952630 [compost metagenome]
MAGQAAVVVLVDLIAVDLVRNGGRLHRIGAHPLDVLVLDRADQGRIGLFGDRGGPAHGVFDLKRRRGPGGRTQKDAEGDGGGA